MTNEERELAIFLVSLYQIDAYIAYVEAGTAAGNDERLEIGSFLDSKIALEEPLKSLRVRLRRTALEHFTKFESLFKAAVFIPKPVTFIRQAKNPIVKVSQILGVAVTKTRQDVGEWPLHDLKSQMSMLTDFLVRLSNRPGGAKLLQISDGTGNVLA